MGRGSATVFHPHCVIYNITDTTTPKFTLRVSSEREKKKLYHFIRVKTMKELSTKNMFPCYTVPLLANKQHTQTNIQYISPVIVMPIHSGSEIYNSS